MKKIKIAIADDDVFFSSELEKLLSQHPNYVVVSLAINGQELIEQIASFNPDLAIVDIAMPVMDGIEATRIIEEAYPETKVIAFCMQVDDPFVISMMQAGALSYILKTINRAAIFEAINLVFLQGRIHFPATAPKSMINLFIKGNYEPLEKLIAFFSEREIEVIGLVCNDLTIKEIADVLRLSPRTVESHRTRIMRKMKVKSVAGMVAYAFKNNLLLAN